MSKTKSRFESITRPISMSLRKASKVFTGEKQLGYRGEISVDAQKLKGQLRLILTDFSEAEKKVIETRREDKHEILEELEFLIEHSTKVRRVYSNILSACRDKLNSGSYSLLPLEPSKERSSFHRDTDISSQTENQREEKKPKILVKKQAAPKKIELLKRGRGKKSSRGGNVKSSSTSSRSSSFSFTNEVSEARKYELINIYPLEHFLEQLAGILKKVSALLKSVQRCCELMEIRIKPRGSVCGVYDPVIGQVEWRECNGGGIFGVWNPKTEVIEWEQKKGYGVHGVYNPALQQVEWKYYRNGGIYGVWNPLKQVVQWKESYREGVCGVWHPIFEQVVFKTFRNGGIVGWFNEQTQDIEWRRKPNHGICIIKRDMETTAFDTICSTFCGWHIR